MTVEAIDKDVVDRLATKFGFQSVKNTEKFLMNMHVHRILSEEIRC